MLLGMAFAQGEVFGTPVATCRIACVVVPPVRKGMVSLKLGYGVVLREKRMVVEEEIHDRERRRRERIGAANKGKVPWNKGKHHSPETIARITQRMQEVMKDPKIREKLQNSWHPHTEETKEKLRKQMKARTQAKMVQYKCVTEWMECIAEMARDGDSEEEELQWDSFTKLRNALRDQYIAKLKEQKRSRVYRRTWTLEQRLKLSETIKTKWNDANYRQKVGLRISESLKARFRGKAFTGSDNSGDILNKKSARKTSARKSESKRSQNVLIKEGIVNGKDSTAKSHDTAVLLDCSNEKELTINNLEEATERKEPLWVIDDSSKKLSTNKVGTYVDPFSAEKLNRIRQRRALKIKDQQETQCTEVAKTNNVGTLKQAVELADLNTIGSLKHGYIRYSEKQQENVEKFVDNCTKVGKGEGAKPIKYGMMEAVWYKAAEEARYKATERARMLLAEAERASLLAAKAFEAAGMADSGLKCSLLKITRDLLDEATQSMNSVKLTESTHG